MDNLAEATMLWLPSYMIDDDDAVADVTKANGLIIDFCDLDISLEQLLDELAVLSVDVDSYRASLDFNLRQRGV